MKRICTAILLVTMCGLSVRADEMLGKNANSTRVGLSDNYTGRLGAGIIIGEPIGGSLKYWFNDTLAIDGAIGWSSHDDTDLYVHSEKGRR